METRLLRHDARFPGAFVQDHRRAIRVHRGRIVEAVDLRTGIMECPRPSPGIPTGDRSSIPLKHPHASESSR